MNPQHLAEQAQHVLKSGNLEQGITLLEQASALAQKAGDLFTQGTILNNLALAQERSGQLDTARKTIGRAVDLLERFEDKDTEELADAVKNVGFIERNLGHLDTAQRYYEVALEIAQSIGDDNIQAKVLVDLGVVHKDRGRLTEARVHFERALALLDDNQVETRASALLGLGLTLEYLQDSEGARSYYLQALDAYRQVGDWENEAVTLHNLGQIEDNQYNFSRALEYYFQSLAINLKHICKLGIAEDLSALAALICNSHQALAVIEQQPDNPLSNCPLQFRDIMWAWRQLLIKALEESEGLTQKGFSLVKALTETENLEGGLALYEQILDFHRSINYPLGQMRTFMDLAFLSRNAEQLDASKDYFSQALELAQVIGNPDDLYEIYVNRGDSYLMAEQFTQAMGDYTAAAEVAESIRAQLLVEAEALNYFGEPKLVVYERLVRLAAKRDRARSSLNWAERAKSREFLRRLRLSEMAQPHQTPEELVDQEAKLMTQLRQLAADLSDTEQPNRLSTLRNYETVEQNIRQVWTEIEFFEPEYVALRQGKPASWKELQRCLRL